MYINNRLDENHTKKYLRQLLLLAHLGPPLPILFDVGTPPFIILGSVPIYFILST